MGGKAVDIEEKLPWYRAFPLGLQHFLSMFGATVLVPTLMGFSPSVSVMCSGIGTALYLLWRSLLGDGLATTVAGFLGAPPATTFAENIGVLNVTRVYATQVFWYAAAGSLAGW